MSWTVGRNVQVDVRFFAGNADRMRTFAKELIDIQPDLALADTTPASKEVKIGEAGDIWIARPHYGHWIGGNDIVAFFESLLTAFANWRKTLSE